MSSDEHANYEDAIAAMQDIAKDDFLFRRLIDDKFVRSGKF